MTELELVFKGIAMSCITGWSFVMIFYTCKHLTLVIKEQYWNSKSENECMIKVKCILSQIDKDFVFFSPMNLAYKLNFIYMKMSYYKKKKFKEEIFKNGLRPRIQSLINNY
jgi:hypothetical protein